MHGNTSKDDAENQPLPWYRSKTGLIALLLVAIAFSAIALISEGRQGASYFWSVEGDLIACDIARPPGAPFRRTMKHEPIRRFEAVQDRQDPDIRILSVYFDRLTFNIPDQNSKNIPGFDAYVKGFEHFLESVHEGRLDSRYTYRHPVYKIMLGSTALAILFWVMVFFLALTRPR